MISYGADRQRIDLEIQTENVEMVVDTAIPCGLIINELITNSLKHAFPDDRTGTISLSFKQLKNKPLVMLKRTITLRVAINNSFSPVVQLPNATDPKRPTSKMGVPGRIFSPI